MSKRIVFFLLIGSLSYLLFASKKINFSSQFEKPINPEGQTVETRFLTPSGFSRIQLGAASFGVYLRQLPLKPDGSKVLLYNGNEKAAQVHAAVVKMEIGKKDLQQCADACIRLRSEYLYKEKRYSDIHFNFTNGWKADYIKWKDGYRISVNGNKCSWQKNANPDGSYNTFRSYLDKVFTYAGTISLSKELKAVNIKNIMPGDVFIQGGSPGHAVMVIDVAENKKTGERIFMLAQSYMPAQEIHVLKNLGERAGSPWYKVDETKVLETPEWHFEPSNLKRFTD